MLFGPIQGLKQREHIPLVGLLRRGEAGLVHTVVDQVILPLVCLVDLLAQGLRVEVNLAVFRGDEVVELFTCSKW